MKSPQNYVDGLLLVWKRSYYLLLILTYLDKANENTPIHLSSVTIENGSVSRLWPFASILAPQIDEGSNHGSNNPSTSTLPPLPPSQQIGEWCQQPLKNLPLQKYLQRIKPTIAQTQISLQANVEHVLKKKPWRQLSSEKGEPKIKDPLFQKRQTQLIRTFHNQFQMIPVTNSLLWEIRWQKWKKLIWITYW